MVHTGTISNKYLLLVTCYLEIKIQRLNLHASRFGGLVNLVSTYLVRTKRSGLVNRLKIGANRMRPKYIMVIHYQTYTGISPYRSLAVVLSVV